MSQLGRSVLTDEHVIPEALNAFVYALEQTVEQFGSCERIIVAYSGGLDSTVLLHLLSHSILKKQLYVRHINHGLQQEASLWAKHCQGICQLWNLPVEIIEIAWSHESRLGEEAIARKLRYQALTEGGTLAKDGLVTGHHQQDQAETVLLNLMRGSGVSGLSAMPRLKVLHTEKGAVWHFRPLLLLPYSALKAYAEHFKLRWVEDPSNYEVFYRRNAIRRHVLPVLTQYWPGVEGTLARTAENMSEARCLLDRMAQSTLKDAFKPFQVYFDFERLSSLDWLEQKNCLRYWFLKQFKVILAHAHYDWIYQVLRQSGRSQNNAFCYQMKCGALHFYHFRLYYLALPLLPYCYWLDESSFHISRDCKPAAWNVLFLNENTLGLQSLLRQQCLDSKGFIWKVPVNLLNNLTHQWKIRSLIKEDKIKRKKLKAFFQMNRIPVWERAVWPVLVCNERLVGVLGCVDCLMQQLPEEDSENETHYLTFFLSHAERYRLLGYPDIHSDLEGETF